MVDSRNNPSTEPVLRAVATILSRHVKHAGSLVVGYSGGLDSTVLLDAVHHLAASNGYRVAARHVHHGLSEHADSWADSCARFCLKLGVLFDVARVKIPISSTEGQEAAARRLRHAALSNHPADWILLAHHADDQAETLLHNLLRGTGLRGAAAMPETHGRLLRPLLTLPRSELLAYAQARRLSWIEDESNADQRYTRNFLRGRVLPIIADRFPKSCHQLAAAARRFGEAESLLEQLAMVDLGERSPHFPVPLQLFRDLPEDRARNLLRALLGWQRVQSPDERRLTEFVRQLRTARSDRKPVVAVGAYTLRCESGLLHFEAGV
jgi:tRNA(Ile)-lysidine synthase